MHNPEAFLANGERYIAGSSDVNKTVRDLVRVAAESVGSNMGALYLLDEKHGVLKPAVIVNLPEAYVAGCGDVALGQQCCGRAALHKMPWYVDDIWNDPMFSIATQDAARRAGVRAAFSIPVLTASKRCLGSLSAHFAEAHGPSEYEIQRHSLFAQLIAFALSRETVGVDQHLLAHSARRVGDEKDKAG